MKVTIISFIIAGIFVLAMFVLLFLSLFFGLDYKIHLTLNLIFLVLAVSAAGFGAIWSQLRLNKEYKELYKSRRECFKAARNLVDTLKEGQDEVCKEVRNQSDILNALRSAR